MDCKSIVWQNIDKIRLNQDLNLWWVLMNMVVKLRVLWNAGELLASQGLCRMDQSVI
jgi:hypothetical protein